jgi:putative transposase
MFSSYHGERVFPKGFGLVLEPFLQTPGLPFAEVLSASEVQAAFEAEGVCGEPSSPTIFTPTVTLWAWLSQVVHGGELSSCAAAVTRVAVLLLALGRKPCSTDTAAYCRARAKLPEAVLQRLVLQVGRGLEGQVPADWLWHGRHVKIADGTTLMMSDTSANQQRYPQQRSQAAGLGFPRMRLMALLSLATAAVCGVGMAACLGKQTGETTLLREMLDLLDRGDILVADRMCCTYFLLTLALERGVDAVVRQHACRKTDFRRGRAIARHEHVVAWEKPRRPDWMDPATYAAIPATLTVREIGVDVEVPGFRVTRIVLVTTLLNEQHYPKEELAELYRQRWHVELDLRSIKCSLEMDYLRTKTPEMVRRDVWVHLLAYNLIRKAAAQAALTQEKLPRQIGFAGTRQMIAASWSDLSKAPPQTVQRMAAQQFPLIAQHKVGDRPNRVEPRAVKRRPKPYRLLLQPRRQARAALLRTRGPQH